MERFGPTRRGGPLFRWLGEDLAIDFANTRMVVSDGRVVDLLREEDGLERWLRAEQPRLGDQRRAVTHLEEIGRLRDSVHGLLTAVAGARAPLHSDLANVNRASARSAITLRLETTPAEGCAVIERKATGSAIDELLAMLARAAIKLVTGPERERLRICNAPSCGMFFLGHRRWCCTACGNRARVARHYARNRSKPDASTSQPSRPADTSQSGVPAMRPT